MNLHFDLCVIGAGAAGLSVAAGAVQLGYDVALIEKGAMGGDCLNTGCVPSKALLAAAKAAQAMRTAHRYGIAAQEPTIDIRAVKQHIDGVIRTIAPHDSQERFEGLGVRVFREKAAFTGKNTVTAGDRVITAKYFVIATGSRPVMPAINGLDPAKALTNETVFALAEKPAHLLIIGAGPVGLEMAQAHRRLGCKVTVIDSGPVLANDDPDLAAQLRDALREEGVKFYENTSVDDIQHPQDGGVIAAITRGADKFQIEGSHILVAAGRKACTGGLGLEKAGVAWNEKGIITDRRLHTTNRRIYAAGDVAGGPQFTHVAGYHAGIIIRNIIFRIPAKTDYSALPWVTYTDPELAQAGLTERAAREKYGDRIKISRWKLKESDRAQTERRTDGMIKVITKRSGRIVGASICAPHAGELIGLWSLAIGQKMKIGAVAAMLAPYPTYGEISKRAAAASFTGALFSNRTRFFTGLLRRIS